MLSPAFPPTGLSSDSHEHLRERKANLCSFWLRGGIDETAQGLNTPKTKLLAFVNEIQIHIPTPNLCSRPLRISVQYQNFTPGPRH